MSDLDKLAADLLGSTAMMGVVLRAAGDVGARDIQAKMRADASQSQHFRIAPRITSEQTKTSLRSMEWEIGPERGGAGSLANIAYFGGSNGGGGTIRDPQLAADAAMPTIERAIETAIGRLL